MFRPINRLLLAFILISGLLATPVYVENVSIDAAENIIKIKGRLSGRHADVRLLVLDPTQTLRQFSIDEQNSFFEKSIIYPGGAGRYLFELLVVEGDKQSSLLVKEFFYGASSKELSNRSTLADLLLQGVANEQLLAERIYHIIGEQRMMAGLPGLARVEQLNLLAAQLTSSQLSSGGANHLLQQINATDNTSQRYWAYSISRDSWDSLAQDFSGSLMLRSLLRTKNIQTWGYSFTALKDPSGTERFGLTLLFAE